MKKIFKTTMALVSAGLMAASCEFDFPEVNVLPDPVFSDNGMQRFQTVSIYAEADIDLEISRIYGLSKEIGMTISINEERIAEYNAVYSSSYTLMPAEYYEIPASVTFEPQTQSTTVPVKVYVQKLVSAVGLEQARKMIIPVEIADATMDIAESASMGYVLVNMDIQEPTVSVSVPDAASRLEFISTIPLPQSVALSASANFTTLDVSKVGWKADNSMVDAFNEANGTECLPLPADKFSVQTSVFDAVTGALQTEVIFDCASIEGEDMYVCPLVMTQDAGYTLVQEEPVYVVIEMSELRIWPTESGNLITSTSGTGSLELQMNSPMTEAQDISLVYDPEAVNAYNEANGTAFIPVDAGAVTVTPSAIAAGERFGNVGYTVDIKDIPYDSGNEYMVAFSVDQSRLVEGTAVPENSTVYVRIFKTLSGVYTKTDTESVFQAAEGDNTFQNVIYLADGVTMSGPAGAEKVVPVSPEGQKYAVYYRSDLWVYFDISDEEMEGHPGCLKIINLRDRVDGFDQITHNASYFDPVNEEFVFDFITLGWWAPGGGGGAALQNPDDLPGEKFHAKLSDRQ